MASATVLSSIAYLSGPLPTIDADLLVLPWFQGETASSFAALDAAAAGEVARALATNPEVLLMDEPASALDPASTSRIEDLIFELRDRYTIVIVTHNMQQAARVSDQTAFFYQGELIEAGSTNELFTNPARKQTEDYITGRFG